MIWSLVSDFAIFNIYSLVGEMDMNTLHLTTHSEKKVSNEGISKRTQRRSDWFCVHKAQESIHDEEGFLEDQVPSSLSFRSKKY